MSLKNRKSVYSKKHSTSDNEAMLLKEDDPEIMKRNNTRLSRRYTQRKPLPSVTEFMTEFEQERRPSPPPTPLPQEEEEITFEDEVFSDTARLTVNASSVSGFKHPLDVSPELPAIYKPASVDPEIDRKKINRLIQYDRHKFFRDLVKAVRGVAERVVNLHQYAVDHKAVIDENKELQERRQEQWQKYSEEDQESDASSVVDENIPMKRTATISNPDQVKDDSTSDVESFSYLSGNSLKLFSPQNPFRVFLHHALCWK